ncbi:MAG: hypothetical protein AB1405_13250 [Bdellovibrionota bacterium]
MSAITSMARNLPVVGTKGFEFSETMSGHHVLEEGPQKGKKLPFSFTGRAFADSLVGFFDPTNKEDRLTWNLEGELKAEGLAKSARLLHGTIEVHPARKTGMLHYAFEFNGDDGRRYVFRGNKNRQGLNLVKSMTTLYGTVTDKETGKRISQGVTYFDLATTAAFIKSYKLT